MLDKKRWEADRAGEKHSKANMLKKRAGEKLENVESAAKFTLIFTGRESLVSNIAIFNQLHVTE